MDQLISTIMGWGANFAPRGWTFCHGQRISISAYSTLYALIGTIYGGDARSTFALPNLQSRLPIGAGQSAGTLHYPLSVRLGVESQTLTGLEIPAHNHPAQISNASAQIWADGMGNGDTNDPAGNVMARAVTSGLSSEPINAYTSGGTDTMAPAPVSGDVYIGDAGGSQSFSIVQPLQSVHFIIALTGTFPSRN